MLALASGVAALRDEPPVRRSVLAGAALVCSSGDKLLGGPQAGLLVGRADPVARARAHPLARAMGSASCTSLRSRRRCASTRDPERARREVPVLAMLDASRSGAGGARRADRRRRSRRPGRGSGARPFRRQGRGRALPLLELEGPAVAVEPGDPGVDALAARLRAGDPPVVGRRSPKDACSSIRGPSRMRRRTLPVPPPGAPPAGDVDPAPRSSRPGAEAFRGRGREYRGRGGCPPAP